MNETIVSDLEPRYDSRKSFYEKANLLDNGEGLKLKSYDTIVAEYFPNQQLVKVHGWYSSTTAGHINEFLRQLGFRTLTKDEMLNKPEVTL